MAFILRPRRQFFYFPNEKKDEEEINLLNLKELLLLLRRPVWKAKQNVANVKMIKRTSSIITKVQERRLGRLLIREVL